MPLSPITTSEFPFSTPATSRPNTPSGRFTSISPASILAVDQGVNGTWRTVMGKERPHDASPSIQFNKKVKVVLIATRQEYEQAGLIQKIYWSADDITAFKEEAVKEIKKHMKENGITHSKIALKHLYQLNP